jgi:hypothetical protein
MTDAIYVRCLPHLERPTPEVLLAAVSPAGPASTVPLEAPPIVCRTTTVRVNLGRVLADLELEARRLLGGALDE